ncbi:L-Ala-D/L-Glu epimerase [Rubrobacter xylanophilus DSM 9941]|uniref:dipeptide epimerase n=1 Tax=Rubrobacter xylanophilus TaxID=49319 RepID=UPI001C64168F|nr:dipeptide epimerase [Rubrobacter xylanophilus]QYJ15819.1 L-Ala-D/L-Glu epimerase [Rubrobacter xylanophilus DSM 9941]
MAGEEELLLTEVRTVTVRTRRTFAIARSSSDVFERVVLEVRAGGFAGRGEAAPSRYYGQDVASVAAALREVEIPDPWDVEGTLARNGHLPSSALAALDGALHDLAARRLGVPVYRLLGLGRPEPESAYTLSIADLETTVAEAGRLRGFPILKVKVGGTGDLATVRAVAEVSEARLWVDANEAFTPDEAPEVAAELRKMGVEMIEQPVPASAGPEALRRVKEAAEPVPVIADESARVASDVPALAGCVSGVNVKLAKCGGIRGALRMLHVARAHGMLAMLGCMVETSLGIAAAAHVSGLFDLVDLDGAALLADDPFRGPVFHRGRLSLTEEPGLGVEVR